MSTRAEIRRIIGKRTGQPFFRRFGGSAGASSASGSTTTLIDTLWLKEEDNYWRGSYVYLPTSDVIREISAFTQSTSTLTWLAATSSVGLGVAYELWSQFTPAEVHDAINYALRTAWPDMFLAAVDESLVIKEDGGLSYTLPTTNTIRRLAQVWIVAYNGERTGTITTQGTTTQVIDANAAFTTDDIGKWVAVYNDSTAARGQIRQVTARPSATELTVSPAFSAAMAADAKYRLLDKNYMYPRQMFLQGWKVDKDVNPTTLYLGSQPVGLEGYVLRLFYEYEYPALSAEATDTTCPLEYVIAAALSYLYLLKLSTSPTTEMDTWAALKDDQEKRAKMLRQLHRQQHMSGTWLSYQQGLGSVPEDYPF